MDATTELSTDRCAVCGQINPPGSLFCSRCTAPLGVVGLHELDESEQRMCLAALMQIMAEICQMNRPAATVDSELWRAYLSAFWLRPETALILYAEAKAIAALAGPANEPWLDLGCGDGVHAALYRGWRFDADFDVFQSLDLSARDIYHAWRPEAFHVHLRTRGKPIHFGVDIKETAVARATALGVFGRVIRADSTRLPLPERSVKTIFSNMLRDLGEPLGAALNECRRVMRDDGLLLVSAMTPAYRRHLYFAEAGRIAEGRGDLATARQMLRLDRGRSVFCQRQLSVEQWRNLLAEHGLVVDAVAPIVGPGAIRFWDVGLRPFATALLGQRESWSRAGVLAAMKEPVARWMDQLLAPLVRRIDEGEPCMNLLAIRKA